MKKHYSTLLLAFSVATAQAQIVYQSSFVNTKPLSDKGQGVVNKANYKADGGSFQHIGQFTNLQSWDARSGTDYFGSTQTGISGYQGKGIQGAGIPYFGHLHVLNTGAFPLSNRPGGIRIAKELVFAESGNGAIITPAGDTFRGANAVFLDPDVTIQHAGDRNHIKGFVHARTENQPVVLPLGDGQRYFPITLHSPKAVLLARYQNTAPAKLPAVPEAGITGFVSEGHWLITPGQAQTEISLPVPEETPGTVFVAGYHPEKQQWIRLQGSDGHGILHDTGITAVALAYSGDAAGATTSFTIWPNPATNEIFLKLPSGKSLTNVTVLDQQARAVKTSGNSLHIPVAELPAGSYVLEVSLTDGSRQTGRFIKK